MTDPHDQQDPDGSDGDASSDSGLALGAGIGAALGVALGLSLDNLALWLPIGIAMGLGIGSAMTGRIGPPDLPDDDDEPGSRRGGPREDGAIARALLWVLVGLLLAGVLFFAVSPELATAAPGASLNIIGLVLLAAIPGTVLLILAAIRRRRLRLDDEERR